MSALDMQGDLFGHVLEAYLEAPDGQLSNEQLYDAVALKQGVARSTLDAREPIGKSGEKHSVGKRGIRWVQQSLKHMKVLQRCDQRGLWQLADAPRKGLHAARSDTRLVAFSTKLGVAIWGRCEGIFDGLDQNIDLCLTSPPYLLQQERAYGNPHDEDEYVEFVVRSLESVVKRLAPGGSVCLNITNSAFIKGTPARSLYREKLVLALASQLGLFKLDELVWFNKSAPPGPIAWASKQRVHLNSSYEPIYWFTNDPLKVRSDNRAVLEPHTRKHMELMQRGGEQRTATYGDGAYRIRPGSFGNVTSGRIPRNVLERGHNCADTRQYRKDAIALGLPVHGAMQPLSLADFLIRFLTREGDLVVDPFGGTVKTGMAAERNGRRWIVVEKMLEYLRGSAPRFSAMPGFQMTPAFASVGAMGAA